MESTTTTLVSTHGRCSTIYLTALIKYYLLFITLYPLAHLLNRSYILHHPAQPLPLCIAPERNTTIHSFWLSRDMHRYLRKNYPAPPVLRRWWSVSEMHRKNPPHLKLASLIILQGRLQGPLLRQGMLIKQGHSTYLIHRELGQLREDLNHIATYSIALHKHAMVPLLIPEEYMDKKGLYVPSQPILIQELTPAARLAPQPKTPKRYVSPMQTA